MFDIIQIIVLDSHSAVQKQKLKQKYKNKYKYYIPQEEHHKISISVLNYKKIELPSLIM